MAKLLLNDYNHSRALAHDIRGMLATVQLAVDRLMLHDDRLVRKQCTLVEKIIDKATEYCSETIKDPRQIDDETTSFTQTMQSVNLILSSFAKGHNIEYNVVHTDANIPSRTSIKLQRILVNLGRNAVQAQKNQDTGRLLIIADSDDDKISVDIIDNGPGMSPEIISELFSDNHKNKSKKAIHVGMGLRSSLAFAHKMNGTIKVLRTGASGTHLRVVIPLTTD